MDPQTIQAIANVVTEKMGNNKGLFDYLSTAGIPGILLLYLWVITKSYQKQIKDMQTYTDGLLTKVITISENFSKVEEAQEKTIDKMLEILRVFKSKIE
jgi:predicted PurR-regulated permease PerM